MRAIPGGLNLANAGRFVYGITSYSSLPAEKRRREENYSEFIFQKKPQCQT